MKLDPISRIALYGVIIVLATPAFAEFTFGGYINGEFDRDVWGTGSVNDEVNIRTNVLGAYDNGDFRVGLGFDWDRNVDSHPDNHFYFLTGFGGLTLTFGDIWGSGSMAGEEYWNMDDSTSKSDQTVRLDYQSSGFSNSRDNAEAAAFGFALSISHDIDASDEPREYGAAVRYGNTFALTAYEEDEEDFSLIFGQHHGGMTYHLALMRDLDNDDPADSQFGASMYYNMFDSVTLGTNLMLDGDGNYHSFGVSALYQPKSGVNMFLELMDEDHGDRDGRSFEFGIHIPIGQSQPAMNERMGSREYIRAYGF